MRSGFAVLGLRGVFGGLCVIDGLRRGGDRQRRHEHECEAEATEGTHSVH
jgi:hypothetical protein